MGRPSRVAVLAEDRRHQRFVHRYLERLGYSFHDIRFEDLPSGRGCGEQWVRQRYAKAVEAYRVRSARAETALVVAIDADTGTLERRTRQLEDSLTNLRINDDRIIHLIPRRHIETWILCLNGEAVDELTDYHHRQVDEQIKPAASTFFDWSRPGVTPPSHCIPSLKSAIPEVRRIE